MGAAGYLAKIALKCTAAVQTEHYPSTEYWSANPHISVIFFTDFQESESESENERK